MYLQKNVAIKKCHPQKMSPYGICIIVTLISQWDFLKGTLFKHIIVALSIFNGAP